MNQTRPEKLKKSTFALGSAALASTVLSLMLSGCSVERQSVSPAPETVSNISVVSAQTANIPDVVEAVGTLRAVETSQLAAQMMGNIVEIRVREGDRVQRGQVLAVIDEAQPRAGLERAMAGDLAAQQEVSAAESDFTLADATFKRYQMLYDRKSVSPQEFDEIKARYQAAQARREMARAGEAQAKAVLRQARTALSYTHVVAPFNGLVTEKKADVGVLASPGMPIFTVEDSRGYRLEATVNESDLHYVRQGERVPVIVDALGDRGIAGKVIEIVPAADPGSRSFLVKVQLPSDPALRSGMFGRAQFARGERTALVVPRTAIVERGQLQGIYVLDQNRIAGLRYITLGKPSAAQIEVLAGLQAGETLIVDPGSRELSGKKIESR
ncbi:MAG TPA: efflux RND transporter periplasmic adaptor subunit [Verrucomicrobiae bacterium]|jgi:RND family efflux transporter MFP subunit|nr:efflux RND transporter periplasmic adaptor subunit [Verrucomicrobiae bacterium]